MAAVKPKRIELLASLKRLDAEKNSAAKKRTLFLVLPPLVTAALITLALVFSSITLDFSQNRLDEANDNLNRTKETYDAEKVAENAQLSQQLELKTALINSAANVYSLPSFLSQGGALLTQIADCAADEVTISSCAFTEDGMRLETLSDDTDSVYAFCDRLALCDFVLQTDIDSFEKTGDKYAFSLSLKIKTPDNDT